MRPTNALARALPVPAQALLAALLVSAATFGLYQFPARLFFDTDLSGLHPYGLVYVAAVASLTLLGGRRLGVITLGLALLGALYLLPPRTSAWVGDPLGWYELAALLLLGATAVLSSGALAPVRSVRVSGAIVAQLTDTHAVPHRSLRRLYVLLAALRLFAALALTAALVLLVLQCLLAVSGN